jgi:hypothetical protein
MYREPVAPVKDKMGGSSLVFPCKDKGWPWPSPFNRPRCSGFQGRSNGPGFGSNPRSHSVRPYTRRDGRFIPPHRRSNPNREWRDNWSTNPNVNPYTRRERSRITPPQR